MKSIQMVRSFLDCSNFSALRWRLTKFTAHNGKIIYFHGKSDLVFSIYDMVHYYESLAAAHAPATSGFARLFLIPGMNHCAGGIHTLDSLDPLAAIMSWWNKARLPIPSLPGIQTPDKSSHRISLSQVLRVLRIHICQLTGSALFVRIHHSRRIRGTGEISLASSFACLAPTGSASESSSRASPRRK